MLPHPNSRLGRCSRCFHNSQHSKHSYEMLKVMMMDNIIVKSCFQDFLVMLTILVRQRLLQQSNIVQTPTYYQIAQWALLTRMQDFLKTEGITSVFEWVWFKSVPCLDFWAYSMPGFLGIFERKPRLKDVSANSRVFASFPAFRGHILSSAVPRPGKECKFCHN